MARRDDLATYLVYGCALCPQDRDGYAAFQCGTSAVLFDHLVAVHSMDRQTLRATVFTRSVMSLTSVARGLGTRSSGELVLRFPPFPDRVVGVFESGAYRRGAGA